MVIYKPYKNRRLTNIRWFKSSKHTLTSEKIKQSNSFGRLRIEKSKISMLKNFAFQILICIKHHHNGWKFNLIFFE